MLSSAQQNVVIGAGYIVGHLPSHILKGQVGFFFRQLGGRECIADLAPGKQGLAHIECQLVVSLRLGHDSIDWDSHIFAAAVSAAP